MQRGRGISAKYNTSHQEVFSLHRVPYTRKVRLVISVLRQHAIKAIAIASVQVRQVSCQTGILLVRRSLRRNSICDYPVTVVICTVANITGNPYLMSREVDDDFRGRVSLDTFLDEEAYNYTAQNTGKHTLANVTMAAANTAGAWSTNSGGITTVTTGLTYGTYAFFPLWGTATTSFDIEAAFSPSTHLVSK